MAHKRKSKSRRRELELADEGSGSERLQKVLAAAGLGSRRECETLISEGRVEVDRVMITELGSKVDPLKQEIRVDGVSLHRPKKVYFALNKPPGVLCTNFDPSHRTKVIDLIPTEERVFPVGRLDSGSEGLIIVTNDGELANRVTHPRYGLDKTYFVRVAGNPSDEELLQLRRGIRLAEGFARVVGLKVRKRYSHHTDMELVLNEGKNREIRRLLAKVGHKVMLLRRTAVGPVKLGDLPLGASRKLMPKEIEQLLEATHRRRESKSTRDANSASDAEPLPPEANVVIKKKPRFEQPRPEKPRPEKTMVSKPREMASATTAPPKVDLATLLNPQTAPKQATLVTPMPIIPASAPTVGDILGYEDDADSSMPTYVPPSASKPKKPKKGLEAKLAVEREANPDFMLTQQAHEPKDHIIRPRDKGKKKFDASKLPPGRRADARRSSRPATGKPASGKPASGSAPAKFGPRRTEGKKPSGKPFGGKPAGGKPSGNKFTGGRSNRPAGGSAASGRSTLGKRGAAKKSRGGR